MERRGRIAGVLAGAVATAVLILAPTAQARQSAKFKVLSLSGTTATDIHVAYGTQYGDTCEYTWTERIEFHSTKPLTAYAFTSKSHGRQRVEWGPKPEFLGNLVQLEIPGEMTVSRTATYRQSTRVLDPETGEIEYGCYREANPDGSPATDCAVERTFPVTMRFGGTSDLERTTYVQADIDTRNYVALDEACYMAYPPASSDPRVFSRADLFNKRQKRIKDSDRVEEPAFDNETDDAATTGTIVETLAGEVKRKKLKKS
jgi:hypothetical protein